MPAALIGPGNGAIMSAGNQHCTTTSSLATPWAFFATQPSGPMMKELGAVWLDI